MAKETFERTTYATEAKPFDTSPGTPKGGSSPLAFVEIIRVVKTSEPIYGGGTNTLGQSVDEMLAISAHEGAEVQSVTLHICEGQWHPMAEHLRATTLPKHG